MRVSESESSTQRKPCPSPATRVTVRRPAFLDETAAQLVAGMSCAAGGRSTVPNGTSQR